MDSVAAADTRSDLIMSRSDEYAREVIRAGRDLGITPRGIVIGLATCLVEAGPIHPGVPGPIVMYANQKVPESLSIPHDDVGDDGFSVGIFQQQVRKGANGQWWWADCATCMDPYASARLFFERLAKRDYNRGDPGAHAQAVQGSAFPDRYGQRMAEAQRLYDRIAGQTTGGGMGRPDFTELNQLGVSPNTSGRGGSRAQWWLLHTQEGNGTAQSLAGYLQQASSQVSYHYTVDNSGVVVDVVDTDLASWSVLNANPKAINLCFAGSRAAWSRNEWLSNMGRAIDIAAYLAVQDCRKYTLAPVVYGPDRYAALVNTTGISDHRFVTRALGMGSHTDVGDGFPWDVFASAVAKYAGGGESEDDMQLSDKIQNFKGEEVTIGTLLYYLDQHAAETRAQLGPWSQLGTNEKGEPLTLVDAVAKHGRDLAEIKALLAELAGKKA